MVSFSFSRCKGTEYRGQIKGKNPVFTGPALLQRDDDGMIRRSEKTRASRCVFFAGAVARDVFSLRRRRNLRGTGRARCEGIFRGAVFDSAEDTYVGTGLCCAGKPVRFFTVDFGCSARSSVRNSALRSGRCMETAIRLEVPLSSVFSVRVCVTVWGRTIPVFPSVCVCLLCDGLCVPSRMAASSSSIVRRACAVGRFSPREESGHGVSPSLAKGASHRRCLRRTGRSRTGRDRRDRMPEGLS